jgi:uncharacterized pyridoxamine 5'-phosphate oxidase family protein
MPKKGYKMNYQDVLDFVTSNPVCSLATSIDNEPHVRAFLTNIVEGQIYFTTSSQKNVGKQLLENQKAELCYLSVDFSKMLRINTTIEIIDDKEMKQYFIDKKEYLKGFSADDPTFLLLSLSNSNATFWTIENNMQEEKLEKIFF